MKDYLGPENWGFFLTTDIIVITQKIFLVHFTSLITSPFSDFAG